jgi:hypothetical protein
MCAQRNVEARSRNYSCRGKAKSIPCFCMRVCVYAWGRVGAEERVCACARVPLIIKHATRRHIVICCLSCLHQIFRHYLIKARFLEKKKLLNIKFVCSNFLYRFYLKYFSFWEEFSAILSWTLKRLHVKHPLFLSHINQTWTFSTDGFSKKLKYFS